MEVLKKIGNNVAKLIDLKSIITIAVVATLCYMTVSSKVDVAVFTGICSSIVQSYFDKSKSNTKDGD